MLSLIYAGTLVRLCLSGPHGDINDLSCTLHCETGSDTRISSEITAIMSSVIDRFEASSLPDVGACFGQLGTPELSMLREGFPHTQGLLQLVTWLSDKTRTAEDFVIQHRQAILCALAVFGVVLLVFALPHLIVALVQTLGFGPGGITAGTSW